MKKISRILSLTLALVMLLSLAPMAFAAGTATVTLVTPAGSTEVKVPLNESFTFPGCDEEYEGYLFECWVPQRYEKAAASDIKDYFFEGGSLVIDADMTFYALYANAQFVPYDKPCYYWSDTREDYSGLWAFVGFNYDEIMGGYVYETPFAMGENGEEVDVVNGLGVAYDSEHSEFYTDDLSIQFEIERQPNGTYTIKNTKSGKYLSISDESIAMRTTRDATSYWDITIDEYDCEKLSNASNSDLVLYYDDENGWFRIFDNTEVRVETDEGPLYASDYFYLNFFAYAEGEWAANYFTTEIEAELYGDCHFADFSDCKDKWYHEAVDYAVENKLMNGVGNGKFEPNGGLTRAMIVTVLYRQAGEPIFKQPATFTDVPAGQWYSDAIAWAQECGIVKGVSETEFAPEAPVTREQIATILWRFAGELDAKADLSSFRDADKISGYAAKAMNWMVSEGILKGDAGKLNPGDNATRAEFACMIMRFLGGSYNCAELQD